MRMTPFVVLLLLLPCAAQDPSQRIDDLIRQLGAEDAAARDEASQELKRIGRPALDAMRVAVRSDDPEVQARAKAILPFVRWSLSEGCSSSTLELLLQLEDTPPGGWAPILKRLVGFGDQAARTAALRVWWETDDPSALREVAAGCLREDSARVEERLRVAVKGGDPVIQRALGDVCRFRGLWTEAADLYALADAQGRDPEILARRVQSLLQAGREVELLELLSGRGDLTSHVELWRVEALYRVGRRADAEAALREPRHALKPEAQPAAMLALRYGSYRLAMESLCGEEVLSVADAIWAWMACGEGERAEALWRAKSADQQALEALLAARDDDDLATPMFLEEATKPSSEDAARHQRLSQAVAEHDPEIALAELRKAVLLDPGHADWFAEAARLAERLGDAPRALEAWRRAASLAPTEESYQREAARMSSASGPPQPRGRGVRVRTTPYWLGQAGFASKPVKEGDSWYFLDVSGCLVKAPAVVGSTPAWRYRVSCSPRATHRDRLFSTHPTDVEIAVRDSRLFALVQLYSFTMDGGHGSSDLHGYMLCELEPDSGKELWTRAFRGFKNGRLFADEGLLTFAGAYVDVFDIRTRQWKWSAVPLHQGKGEAVASGDAVYVGFPSGALYKLRAEDGALLWKKEWPDGLGQDCTVLRAGRRLLFRSGLRIVCLALEDDSVAWQMRLPGPVSWPGLMVSGDRFILCCANLSTIQAVSLQDGAVLWSRDVPRTDGRSWQLLDGVLIRLDYRSAHVIDVSSGKLLCATGAASRGYLHRRPIHSEGANLVVGSSNSFGAFDSAYDEIDRPHEEAGVEFRLLLEPAPESGLSSQVGRIAGEDPRSLVTLLEDEAAIRGSMDAATWRSLADASLKDGRRSWAASALLQSCLFSVPTPEEVRSWRDAFATPAEGGKGVDRESQELLSAAEGWERSSAAERAVKEADPAKLPVGDAAGIARLFDHLACADPTDAAPRRTAWLVRWGDSAHLPDLLRVLPGSEDWVAETGLAALIRLGFTYDDAIYRLWPRDRHQSVAVRSTLRALLDHPSAVVRGGALAAIELADETVEAPDAETWLRAARATGDPLVRLAAVGSLHQRGLEDAVGPVTQALGSESHQEVHFAAWLAGRLRLAGAVDPLATALDTPVYPAAYALVAIGTQEAWRALHAWRLGHGLNADVAIAEATRRLQSQEGAALFLDVWNRDPSYTAACVSFNALLPFHSDEARHARAEIGLDLLQLCTQEKWLLISPLDALLEEGRLVEARGLFERLDERSAPTAWLEEFRMRLLAAEGDLGGAQKARDLAVRRLEHVRTLEPAAWQIPLEMAQLYMHPGPMRDPDRARELLDEALRLAPGEPDVLESLESLRGR